ncbi:FG-GAP repeat protein [Streptomyces sp. A012304]|uniref:FG-GAP repeat protein n=1 Tax=Streptomyces sp. A012304 TaxID=375446 RepID=UPI00222F94A9|nr:FG-GAP repeat protein [Streptomyces sp. A012304]GKQ41782.1 hypothetical protein ALMP_82950 [Streptomyces sp. A012304]
MASTRPVGHADDITVFYGPGRRHHPHPHLPYRRHRTLQCPHVLAVTGSPDWDQAVPHTGDFNGDGHDDLAALRQQNGTVQTRTWNWSILDATFKGGVAGWSAPATSWPYAPMRIAKPCN